MTPRIAASRGPGTAEGLPAGHRLLWVDMTAQDTALQRSYEIRTYGCQMNVHDSERLAGLLEDAGYVRAPEDADGADVVVFNTCAVRENADNRLYGNLGQLAPKKAARPGMQIAVGGCLAQKDRDTIVKRAPWVDVVFGTHNIGQLPVLLERARIADEAQVEIAESLEAFPSTLPTRRESAYAAWVAISVGCNNTCTFCIVPALRGKEKDRRPGDILAEVEALVAEGVIEVTLLGQNVNAYGSDIGDREAFGKLLRACGAVEGLERVRFTSPHPRDFTDDVIAAMARDAQRDAPAAHAAAVRLRPGAQGDAPLLPAGPLPRHHREGARRHAGRRHHHRHHRGLPRRDRGGLRADPARGARGPLRRRRSPSSTPSGPAPRPPSMDGQIPKAGRPGALRAAGRPPGGDLLGGEQEAGRPHPGGPGRRGRGPQGRRAPAGCPAAPPTTGWCTSSGPREPVRPGDMVTVEITYAAPHHLLAERPRWPSAVPAAGDAWERRAGRAPAEPDRGDARPADHRRPCAPSPGCLPPRPADVPRELSGGRTGR